MSEVHIIAIFYPKPGKVQQMKDVLSDMSRNVHEKEDYTLRYIMTEQIDAETPDIVMIETYKDKASAERHTTEPHFKETFRRMEEGDLMAKPPYLAYTANRAGFDLDHKLM